MGKYTFKILTQGVVKIYVEIRSICSLLIFGNNPLPTELVTLFHRRGVFYQTGFNNSKNSISCLLSYRSKNVHDAIWRLKFKNQRKIAGIFGMLLSDYLCEELSNQYYLENFSEPILLVVPSHKTTLRTRGYNPVDLIVRESLKQGLDSYASYMPNLIKKTKFTQRQSRIKNRSERMQNPKGCFSIIQPTLVRDRNIIVVDDVYTTGATMGEVVRILKSSGAHKIMSVTMAH